MDGLSENTKSFSYDRFHGSEAQRVVFNVQCLMVFGGKGLIGVQLINGIIVERIEGGK